jgi:hypothetical protein
MSCESTLAALRVAVALFVFGALFGQYVVLPVAAIPDWIAPASDVRQVKRESRCLFPRVPRAPQRTRVSQPRSRGSLVSQQEEAVINHQRVLTSPPSRRLGAGAYRYSLDDGNG